MANLDGQNLAILPGQVAAGYRRLHAQRCQDHHKGRRAITQQKGAKGFIRSALNSAYRKSSLHDIAPILEAFLADIRGRAMIA